MEHKTMPGSNYSLPLLGFGCMRLPLESDKKEIEYTHAKAMVDKALASGLNYFDTAYQYHDGKSELFLAKALAEVPRNSYFLADKLPVYMIESLAQAKEIFYEQLEKCNTEYFDFYLMHTLSGKSFAKAEELGIYNFLEERKNQGQIRQLGFSFHDAPESLEPICMAHSWDFAQIQLNYLDWENYRSREQYQILEKHQIPCIVMEPIRGGMLADLGEGPNALLKKTQPNASIASWALRYAASLPNVITVLSGMSTLEQLDDNLKTFTPFIPLSSKEQEVLGNALALFYKHMAIPCTGCHYCMPCPVGLDIPANFLLWNKAALKQDKSVYTEECKFWPQTAKAENCIACKKCVELCPQKLNIPQLLNLVAKQDGPGF